MQVLQQQQGSSMSGRRMSNFNLPHSGIDAQRQLPKRIINVVKHLPYSVERCQQDGECQVKQLSLGPIVSAYRLMKEVGKLCPSGLCFSPSPLLN